MNPKASAAEHGVQQSLANPAALVRPQDSQQSDAQCHVAIDGPDRAHDMADHATRWVLGDNGERRHPSNVGSQASNQFHLRRRGAGVVTDERCAVHRIDERDVGVSLAADPHRPSVAPSIASNPSDN